MHFGNHDFLRICLILSLNAYLANTVFFVTLGSVYMVLKHRRRSEVFILFISDNVSQHFLGKILQITQELRTERGLDMTKYLYERHLGAFASYYGLWLHGRPESQST